MKRWGRNCGSRGVRFINLPDPEPGRVARVSADRGRVGNNGCGTVVEQPARTAADRWLLLALLVSLYACLKRSKDRGCGSGPVQPEHYSNIRALLYP
jgi:hypothetical protein